MARSSATAQHRFCIMAFMRLTLLILLACSLWAGETEEITIKEGFERAQERYQRDSCDRARAQAKANYEIVELDGGCRCERTDDRLWQCDIGFTYKAASPHTDE